MVEVDLTRLCVLQHGLDHGETEMVLYSSWAGGQEVHHGDHGQVDAGENEEESGDHLDDQGRRTSLYCTVVNIQTIAVAMIKTTNRTNSF